MFKDFFYAYREYKNFKALNKQRLSIVVYSESAGDLPHLEPVFKTLSQKYNQVIYYLTSDSTDRYLKTNDPNIKSFYIGSGTFRTLVFHDINTKILIMTLPDLETYYLKRSVIPSHYIYVYHSINSTHMVYRKGAFDHYDTVFCVGPHHVKEIRETERVYGLPGKNLVEHGYGRLDSIIAENKKRPLFVPSKGKSKKILLAPSWGKNSITNRCAEKVIKVLLDFGHQVTFRPHSMSVRLENRLLKGITGKFKDNPLFKYETDLCSQDSLHLSDVMISDFSGAATEFAFGLEKPVISIDLPKKINNPEHGKIAFPTIENEIRDQIGSIVTVEELQKLPAIASSLCDGFDKSQAKIISAREKWIFNIGSSGEKGAVAVMNILKKIQ